MAWFCSQIHWFLENGFNFSAHLLVVLVLWTAGAVYLQSWRAVGIGVLGIGVGVTSLVLGLRYVESADPRAEGLKLRVMTYNVLSHNDRYQDVRRFIRDNDPDILVATETTPAWALELSELEDLYPYTERAGRMGIMVLSKFPLTGPVLWISDKWVKQYPAPDYWQARDRLIRGVRYGVKINGSWIALVGVHVSRPSTASLLDKRDQEFEILTARLDRETLPVILAGDFNASPLSPAFSQWAVRNRMRGPNPFVLPPLTTYPVWAPGFGIQIDHILTRGPIALRDYWAGPGLGSNHRPLVADLALKLGKGEAREDGARLARATVLHRAP